MSGEEEETKIDVGKKRRLIMSRRDAERGRGRGREREEIGGDRSRSEVSVQMPAHG